MTLKGSSLVRKRPGSKWKAKQNEHQRNQYEVHSSTCLLQSIVHVSTSAQTNMGPRCLHLPLTSCVPSISRTQFVMSHEGAGCRMTSEGPAQFPHSPALRSQQSAVQRGSLGHQVTQCTSSVPRLTEVPICNQRACLLKKVPFKEKK